VSPLAGIAWALALALAQEGPRLSLSSDVDAVELGLPFSLRVERTWPAGWTAEPWSARALAPLSVELEASARAEREESVTETLRYSARAFQLEDVDFARFAFAVQPPGEPAARIVTAAPGGVRVLSALPAGDDGAPELPARPPAAPRRGPASLTWLAPGLAASAWLGWRAGRARARSRTPAHDAWVELERSWARIEASRGAGGPTELDALAHLLREALVLRGISARAHTAEEARVAAGALGELRGDELRDLAAVLSACERARFGAPPPDADSWAGLLASARRAFGALRRAGRGPAEGGA